jgi:ADP-heptose:LPS heptosyltransferase
MLFRPKETSTLKRRHRLGQPLPQRLVILRALQLGDLLCTVPALRALRAALPGANIVLVGLPWAAGFVARFSQYVDSFREFPGLTGLPEQTQQLSQLPEFLAAMKNEHFDLALQMHGSGSITNPLLVEFGARVNAGYYLPGELCPDNKRFLAYPGHLPEVQVHMQLMEFLGIPSRGADLEFPLADADFQELHVVLGASALPPGSYVCLHPGARALARRWPLEHFARVGDTLASQGLRVVLTGSQEEAAVTAAVRDAMYEQALDLAGRTSLGALGALLKRSRLLICNDTGVAHLATALQVPSVVVFHQMAQLKRRAAPDRHLHRALFHEAGVQPELVLAQARDLLQRPANDDRAPQANTDVPLPGKAPSVLAWSTAFTGLWQRLTRLCRASQ